jgi:hypothetical protein
MELFNNMNKDKLTSGLLYLGIFAGIPLAIIVALFFLPVLNSVDPTAIVILIIFTVVLVALWIFVPYEKPIKRQRKGAKVRNAAARGAVPVPSESSDGSTDEEKRIESSEERREPFVDAVEKSTHRPSTQPQIRRKAKNKARKKSSKKKR